MRRIYLYVIIMLESLSCFAQQKEYSGQMHVTPQAFEQRGDSLYIKMKFDISGVNVDSRRSISLIPSLVTSSNRLDLPAVMVKGRRNYRVYKRGMSLMSKREKEFYLEEAPYAVMKGYKATDAKSMIYSQAIKYEPWMAKAKLDMYEDLCGCGNSPRRMGVTMLADQVSLENIILMEPYVVIPHLAYIQPTVEAVKHREIVGEAFLDFVVSRVDIRPDYMNNPRELKKITDLIAEVKADPNITVRAINVIGYASPEGTLAGNKRLSEGRAKALTDYLLPRFDYAKEMYKVVYGGENWIGLREIVEFSSINQKDQILSIIDDKAILDDQRKSRLKNLANGDPYRYMLKEWFPSLRKAICKIDFDVKNFSIEEAKRVFKNRPQNLSLKELFLVAGTYEKGSQEFIDIFETAVRIYPDDQTANINAAAAALTRSDVVYAKRYLSKVTDAPQVAEYYNTVGVLAILEGDFDKAEAHLNKAVSMGSVEAKQNLDELAKKRINAFQIEKQKEK